VSTDSSRRGIYRRVDGDFGGGVGDVNLSGRVEMVWDPFKVRASRRNRNGDGVI